MDVCSATFTITQIEALLAEKGIFRPSIEFLNELDRRFRPADIGGNKYVEREDWPGDVPASSSPGSRLEVMGDDVVY